MELHLSFNIHGHQPDWAKKSSDKMYADSRYRVYVDDELIIERTWNWGNRAYLNENIWVNVDPGKHLFRVEPILMKNPDQATFSIENIKANNTSIDLNNDRLDVYFSI